MVMFGWFPQQDPLRLTTYHICHLTVKTEAFLSHLELRHGQPQQAAGYTATANASIATPIMQQQEQDIEVISSADRSRTVAVMGQQEESLDVQQDSGMVCEDEILNTRIGEVSASKKVPNFQAQAFL